MVRPVDTFVRRLPADEPNQIELAFVSLSPADLPQADGEIASRADPQLAGGGQEMDRTKQGALRRWQFGDTDDTRQHRAFREVGHELRRHAGDSELPEW